MAETRKHRTEVRDALDQAILAALGENVRPVTPGSEDPFDGAAEPTDTEQTDEDQEWHPGRIPPGTTLGSIVFPPSDAGGPAVSAPSDEDGPAPD